jgi:hypothetical protein
MVLRPHAQVVVNIALPVKVLQSHVLLDSTVPIRQLETLQYLVDGVNGQTVELPVAQRTMITKREML